MEFDRSRYNEVALVLGDSPIHFILYIYRNVNVENSTAAIADKMIVRCTSRLVYVAAAPERQSIYATFINENVEITVHIAQTHMRISMAQLFVHPLRTGVDTTAFQKLKYTFPLLAGPWPARHDEKIRI